MLERPPISSGDFFSNAAAREIGFTDQFWFDVYAQWLEAIRNDPTMDMEVVLFGPRTFRMPFRDGAVDVLVRGQPDGREYYAIRFTAFPAADAVQPPQIERWYQDTETRAVLGEAVLLDVNFPW